RFKFFDFQVTHSPTYPFTKFRYADLVLMITRSPDHGELPIFAVTPPPGPSHLSESHQNHRPWLPGARSCHTSQCLLHKETSHPGTESQAGFCRLSRRSCAASGPPPHLLR